MKRLVTIVAAAASFAMVSVALSGQANAGAVLDRVLSTKTLTVAVGTDWGKNSFLDEKHELVGYDVDVAKEIAKSIGVEAKFVTPSFDVILTGKWEGRWDLATFMAPRVSRTDRLSFPAVYLYSDVIAVVHKDSQATKLSDLDGKIVGAVTGTQASHYLDRTLTPDWVGAKPIEFEFKPEPKLYQSTNVALDDLRLGDCVRVCAVTEDGGILRGAIESGYPIKVLGVLFTSPSALVTLPGDKEFDDKVAAAIKKMKDDGTLAKLSVKWFGIDRTAEK